MSYSPVLKWAVTGAAVCEIVENLLIVIHSAIKTFNEFQEENIRDAVRSLCDVVRYLASIIAITVILVAMRQENRRQLLMTFPWFFIIFTLNMATSIDEMIRALRESQSTPIRVALGAANCVRIATVVLVTLYRMEVAKQDS